LRNPDPSQSGSKSRNPRSDHQSPQNHQKRQTARGSSEKSWDYPSPSPGARGDAELRATTPDLQIPQRTGHRTTVQALVSFSRSSPGRGPEPLPLLLTHGWPGSFCEYLEVLGLLSDPAEHGGDPADAFTVIVPSLPGFGFSAAAPAAGLTYVEVAELWHRLMADGLNYRRYVAHGSDLGAGVTARLARAHPEAVVGIHLATPGLPAPAPDRGPPPRIGTSRRSRCGVARRAATSTCRPPSRRRSVPRCMTRRLGSRRGSGRRSCRGAAPRTRGSPPSTETSCCPS